MKLSRIFLLAFVALSVAVTGCKKDDTKDDTKDENYDVIVGKWTSPEVAPILATFVDSIHAEFRNDQTYLVTTFKDGAESELKGSYETADGVGTIRNIVLEQSSPTGLTSTGIFQVDGDKMTYEVAQTEPAQTGVTAPTAEEGFGSTSGGAFGEMNIQVYYKIK